jgi:hypothetical protein
MSADTKSDVAALLIVLAAIVVNERFVKLI